MEITQYFQALAEPLQRSASVKNVYGDPIEAEGKTIIPVARIAYGFGAGGGKGEKPGQETGEGEGGGGGGGVRGVPAGVVEVTRTGTRFIRFDDNGRLVRAVLFGFALGFLYAKGLRR